MPPRGPKKPLAQLLRDSTVDELEGWSSDELTPVVDIRGIGQRIDDLTAGTIGLVVEVKHVKERLEDVEAEVRAGHPCQQAKQIERIVDHLDEGRQTLAVHEARITEVESQRAERRSRNTQIWLALLGLAIGLFSSIGGVVWWARGAQESTFRALDIASRNSAAIETTRDKVVGNLKDEVRDHGYALDDHAKRLTMVEDVSAATKSAVDKLQPRPRRHGGERGP